MEGKTDSSLQVPPALGPGDTEQSHSGPGPLSVQGLVERWCKQAVLEQGDGCARGGGRPFGSPEKGVPMSGRSWKEVSQGN